jgi:hypothetical protein
VSGWRAPAAPAGIAASDGTLASGVQLTWPAVSGISQYAVLRAQGAALLTEIGTAYSNSYLDATATPGVIHRNAVRAHRQAPAPQSPEDRGWRSLAAPASVNASDGLFTDKVRVNWTVVPGATGYKVLRSSGTDPLTVVASIGSTDIVFPDLSASVGVTYTYVVRATTPLGDGPDSASVTGWRAPAAPAGLTATNGAQSDRVQLGWNPVPQGTGYVIFRKSGESAPVSIGNASTPIFLDTTAVPGILYEYFVRTNSPAGNGPPSGRTPDGVP